MRSPGSELRGGIIDLLWTGNRDERVAEEREVWVSFKDLTTDRRWKMEMFEMTTVALNLYVTVSTEAKGR